MELVGDFYAYLWPGVTMAEMQRYGNNSNSYVVAGVLPGDKHLLLDPGMVVNEAKQHCLDRLISEMEEDGLKIEDTGVIINTHNHPDHYAASEAIRKMSGAIVGIGGDEGEFLRLMEAQMPGGLEAMGMKIPEIKPDFYLTEGELNLGQKQVVKVLVIPGHANGHIGLYWPDAKVFMGGDLIFHGSTGRVDFPGGSAQKIKESIERVAKLDIEYLLTGHQYGSPGIIAGKQQIMDNFDNIRSGVFPYL